MTVNLWAVMLVRDELDVIEHTLRHVEAQGVSGIIVSDHGSVDGTRELLESMTRDLDCKLLVIDDTDPGHYQSSKTTLMARTAWDLGAEWVWPCDADEIAWHDSSRPLADALEDADGNIAEMMLFNHYTTSLDPAGASAFQRMPYRGVEPLRLPKVIVKWAEGCVIHDGNHGATHPDPEPSTLAGLRVEHCPYRSADQFIRKVVNGGRALLAADLPDITGAHWRGYYALYLERGEEVLREVYAEHFTYADPAKALLIHDPIPICG